MTWRYKAPQAGGEFDHKGGDCPVHGDNVPFAKPYRSDELFECVRCLLERPEEPDDANGAGR